ncbi:Sen15 protein-domain-containing protein [Cokeromyces recurvatus]|uniref:Sen15 protein-domain-containing protein n=1 Tax=Cokeromyces recurvatus TaxID=90255 RepID=UPI00221EE588|nr:Sen15 protein-domain-containing protein [Cokeromyces recurvatus]KAI7905208.1 Sen15 protein-domain-containing protein [Cokeromyces recurvatus]
MNLQDKLKDIETKSVGFPSSNVALSQRIYTDLVLAKKWRHVEYKPAKELATCVFLAYEPGNMNEQLIVLPISQDKTKLTIDRITEIFDKLNKSYIIDSPIEKLTLAIYYSDSTVLYYHLSKGLAKKKE